MERIKKFLREESGAPATEYVLLAALIAGAITVGVGAMGGALNTYFNGVATWIGLLPPPTPPA